jgi:hypothetical protein
MKEIWHYPTPLGTVSMKEINLDSVIKYSEREVISK